MITYEKFAFGHLEHNVLRVAKTSDGIVFKASPKASENVMLGIHFCSCSEDNPGKAIKSGLMT